MFESVPLAVALALCSLLAGGALWIVLPPPPSNMLFCKVLGREAAGGFDVVQAVGIAPYGLVTRAAAVKMLADGEVLRTRAGDKRVKVVMQDGAAACYLTTEGDGVAANNIASLPDCAPGLAPAALPEHRGPCPSGK